jgi:hypothetical protein
MSGRITVENMINYSRLHATDLDGLRPLCEDTASYEAAMIYKIPNEHANLLSCGWFAANHPCSSIYVPVHICDNDVYDPYQTGEAAALSLELLHRYGHGTLTPLCQKVENVFLSENEENEILAHQMIHNASDITPFLTTLDEGMQEQAFLTEQLWLGAPNASRQIIENIWMGNYTLSLQRMQQTVSVIKNLPGMEVSISIIGKIALSICKSKIEVAVIQGRNWIDYEQGYTAAHQYFMSGDYTTGFAILYHIFDSCNSVIKGTAEL